MLSAIRDMRSTQAQLAARSQSSLTCRRMSRARFSRPRDQSLPIAKALAILLLYGQQIRVSRRVRQQVWCPNKDHHRESIHSGRAKVQISSKLLHGACRATCSCRGRVSPLAPLPKPIGERTKLRASARTTCSDCSSGRGR